MGELGEWVCWVVCGCHKPWQSGEWRVESGEWRVESGEWRVAHVCQMP